MNDEVKLVQDFLEKNGLAINQGDFTIKTINDGSIIIGKPLVTIVKTPPQASEVVTAEESTESPEEVS